MKALWLNGDVGWKCDLIILYQTCRMCILWVYECFQELPNLIIHNSNEAWPASSTKLYQSILLRINEISTTISFLNPQFFFSTRNGRNIEKGWSIILILIQRVICVMTEKCYDKLSVNHTRKKTRRSIGSVRKWKSFN